MIHNHHIKPKHMGGTDDLENIEKLTIEEHANAHKKLWEEHRCIEDYLAWQGLSGLMKKQEIVALLLSEAGKKGARARSKEVIVRSAKIAAAANWEKNKDKILTTLRKNADNNKKLKEETGFGLGGHKPGDYVWITNGKENKKIRSTEEIVDGWFLGRTKTWKTKSSNNAKEIVECDVCGKKGGKPVMKRYHFENCKASKVGGDGD